MVRLYPKIKKQLIKLVCKFRWLIIEYEYDHYYNAMRISVNYPLHLKGTPEFDQFLNDHTIDILEQDFFHRVLMDTNRSYGEFTIYRGVLRYDTLPKSTKLKYNLLNKLNYD